MGHSGLTISGADAQRVFSVQNLHERLAGHGKGVLGSALCGKGTNIRIVDGLSHGHRVAVLVRNTVSNGEPIGLRTKVSPAGRGASDDRGAVVVHRLGNPGGISAHSVIGVI